MTLKLHKFDSDEPRDGRAVDSSSPGSAMIVGDVQGADGTTATPNRRLRNWILLANVLAWIAIIVAIRWIFF